MKRNVNFSSRIHRIILLDIYRRGLLLLALTNLCAMASSTQPMSLPEPSNVLSLSGALDLHASPSLRASLAAMIERKPSRVVIDLSKVTYIDSSGLAVLIDAMQQLEQQAGLLMLAGVSDSVRTVLESSRLENYFLTFPHVDAALAAT